MFENILFGPMCMVFLPKDKIMHLANMEVNGYYPIAEIIEGELFEEVELHFGQKKLKSIILCIGYKKIPKE